MWTPEIFNYHSSFCLEFAQQANATGILVSWQPISLGYLINKHDLLSNWTDKTLALAKALKQCWSPRGVLYLDAETVSEVSQRPILAIFQQVKGVELDAI